MFVWRLGALGDTLLTLPALAALRHAFPRHRVALFGAPPACAPALWSGLADEVFDASVSALAPLVSGDAPAPGVLPAEIALAVVWSARHEEIGRGLARAGAARVVSAPALPPTSTGVVLPPMPIVTAPSPMPIGAAAYYLDTLAPLGVAPVPFMLAAPHQALGATAAGWHRATEGARHVAVLHPGAGSTAKRWPLGHYLALAAALRADGLTVAWSLGPAEEDLCGRLTAAGESAALLPAVDVAGLAAYLSRAAVMVSGDCGPAHQAALMRRPALTLFGPTDPRAWAPPNDRGLIQHLALACAPCGDAARACPSRICLRGLSPRRVHAAVTALLDRPVNGDTAPGPAPLVPSICHPRRPAPAPPGALQVANWADGRTRATAPSIGQG